MNKIEMISVQYTGSSIDKLADDFNIRAKVMRALRSMDRMELSENSGYYCMFKLSGLDIKVTLYLNSKEVQDINNACDSITCEIIKAISVD